MLERLFINWLKPLYQDVRQLTLDTLFPVSCVVCGQEGDFICVFCKTSFKPAWQQCIVCKKPSLMGLTHAGCKTPHGVDGLVSVLDYRDENVAKAIVAGKYHYLEGVFTELGKKVATKLSEPDYASIFLMAHIASDQQSTNSIAVPSRAKLSASEAESRDPSTPSDAFGRSGWTDKEQVSMWHLVPIPLSKQRLRWRGFNQAQSICEAISAKLNIPISPVLIRTKNTKVQKDLKKEARTKNVSDAFALSPNSKFIIQNSKFILVDDVVTTGSTLMEAAKVLKRNGAAEVWCLAVARD